MNSTNSGMTINRSMTMLWTLVLVCVLGSTWGNGDDEESRVVTIKQGSVRGYKSPDGDFYVFYGVPYATAPTGSQRYKAPLPPPVWLDTFEAVNEKIVCPQHHYLSILLGYTKEEKENCLIANIFVPESDEKELPVLVYVHGGSYIIGYSNFMRPNNLVMTKRAIIVNFNYRLGAHGFLCLGTNDIPGNAGMKDQVALLRWVRDNIASFGGNPEDVTIAGYSAGSSAVDLLQLSKMANDLFKKVIPESGANVAAFSVQVDPIAIAKKYATKLNFSNVDDIYALEEFYKTASYDTLTSVNVFEELDGTFVFSPCVERDIGTERFLDDSPVNILKSGNYQKRPMLYGFANMEGLNRVYVLELWKDGMNTRLSDYFSADLQFESNEEKEKIASEIRKFYFGNKPVSEDNILGYVNYFSDIIFAYPTLRSVRLQVEAGNDQIYLYEYAFTDDDEPVVPHTSIRGADHCAQSRAVHDGMNFTHSDESNISKDLKNMKRVVREMWMNFATTGKPVPEGSSLPAWPPTGANASPYMVLDKVTKLLDTPLLEKRARFWDKIYSKYYRYPVAPSEPPPTDSQPTLQHAEL